jgi:hypothetical protein
METGMADRTKAQAEKWISAACAAVLALAPVAAGAQAISSEPLGALPGSATSEQAAPAAASAPAPARPAAPLAAADSAPAAQPAAPAVKSASAGAPTSSALGHSAPGATHKHAPKKLAALGKIKKHKPLIKTADAAKPKPKHKALKPKTAAPENANG